MGKSLVWITDDRFGDEGRIEREVLGDTDVELRVNTNQRPDAAVFRGSRALLVNQYRVEAPLIRALPDLSVISRYGVGYDNVDVAEATTRGVWVAYVPDYASEDVSDHAVALLLACIRRVPFGDRRVREGGWNLVGEYKLHRTLGRTLGIIGYGRIGRAVQAKMSGFALAGVLVHDPLVEPGEIRAGGARPCSLEELLEGSDYVSINAPLTPKTRGMIGERELGRMRPGSVLVNTSRGPLVDEGALHRALREGRLAAAALDVFETEPLDPASPLLDLPQLILSSHMAWYTEESLVELRTKAAANVRSVLRGERPAYPLNDPGGA